MQFLYRDASFSFGNKAAVLLLRCWFRVHQKFFAFCWHFSWCSSGKELPWWSLRLDSPLADDSGGVSLWGIRQSSKLREHFGGVEELCCLWEGRKGQPGRGISATNGGGVCGSKQGMFRVLRMFSKAKVTKPDVMLRGEIVQKYRRKWGCLCSKELSLAMRLFTKQLKRKKHILQKRFAYMSYRMVSVILNDNL